MKYNEMDDSQQAAFRDFLMQSVDRRINEETEYTNQLYRLLVLGNGTGIVLLATFMGSIAAEGRSISPLVPPLWKFFIGAVLAACIYFPLMAVASQATLSIANQVVAFFKNELDVEDLQGYGLNKLGRMIVLLLAISSLLLFGVGVYQCMAILSKLGA